MTRALARATFFFVTTAGAALAQAEQDKVIYKKITELDMTGIDVQATVEKPLGAVVNETRRPQFNPMSKLRMDFDAEVEQSVEVVR